MIVYITGASGSGKTTLLEQLPIKGYDLDDIYENNWKKQGGEIQHLDLIRKLVEKTLELGFKIEYRWLKGHKGGESQHAFPWMFNHQVDALANSALRVNFNY
jgi:adenylylsulfate kinase-like enzyme